jgi:glycosyltransferase involved in cell wall biosynthesis
MKMIESMSYGIPVVSTKIGAQGIHVINGKQAMVANSASEFIGALSEILSDPQKSVAIGQEGRLFTEEHFNLQQNTQKLLSFYDKLIKEKNEIII